MAIICIFLNNTIYSLSAIYVLCFFAGRLTKSTWKRMEFLSCLQLATELIWTSPPTTISTCTVPYYPLLSIAAAVSCRLSDEQWEVWHKYFKLQQDLMTMFHISSIITSCLHCKTKHYSLVMKAEHVLVFQIDIPIWHSYKAVNQSLMGH